MIKYSYIVLFLLFSLSKVYGQIQTNKPSLIQANNINIDNLDIPEYAYDLNFNSEINDTIFSNDSLQRIGKNIDVNINIKSSSYVMTYNNYNIYLLKIKTDSSLGISLDFEELHLTPNADIFVFNKDRTQKIGSFNIGNILGQKLPTTIVEGNEILIEVDIPISESSIFNGGITRIKYILIDFYGQLESSANCYTDVNCVSGYPDNRFRSVFYWTYDKNGSGYSCSGVLLNQYVNPNDLKYYVYTAEHCGDGADLSTTVFYFQRQKPNCNGSVFFGHTVAGATFKAEKSLSDMYLMELNTAPPPDYNLHFAGWDYRDFNDIDHDLYGIHHPDNLEKKYSEGYFVANTNVWKWRVDWNSTYGPTYKGSSGSPLFTKDYNRVVGDLSSGLASCSNPGGTDRYGKFKKQWSDLGGSSKRLKDWLDPNGSDPQYIDGVDPCFDYVILNNRGFLVNGNVYQQQNKVEIQSNNVLLADGSNTINSNGEFVFTATNEIQIVNEFSVFQGANFSAYNAGCTQIAVNHRTIKENKFGNDTIVFNIYTNKFTVYPNPILDNHFTIQFDMEEFNQKNEGAIDIEIYDLLNKRIFNRQIYRTDLTEKGIFRVDLNTTNSHVLFLKIKSHHYEKNIKLLNNN
jgi:hypothetical protein